MGKSIAVFLPILVQMSPISVISLATPAIKNTKGFPKAPVLLNISKAIGELPSEQTSIIVAKQWGLMSPQKSGQ